MYESGLLIEDALLRFSEASDTPKYYYFDNGISGYYNRYLDDVGFNDTLIPLSVVNNVEGAEVLVVPGETYNGVHMASPQDYGQPGGPFVTRTFACVNASVDDTKLERILRVFDDMSFEYENAFYLWNGTEGRDYTMETTAAGWERRVPVEDADLVAVGTRVTAGYYLPAWYYEDYIKSAGAAYEMYLAWGNAQEYLDARLYDYRYDFENETDIITVQTNYDSSVEALTKNYAIDVITGEKDALTSFSEYLEELEDVGLEQYIAEINKMPIVENYWAGEKVYD